MRPYALLAGLLLPGSASAATWNVCPSSCTFATIGAAHASSSVKDGDTLQVAAGTYTETGLTITKDLVIDGEGPGLTKIYANSGNVLYFYDAVATLKDVTVDPGSSATRAIYVYLGTLTLENIEVDKHSAYDAGIGLNASSATVYVKSSVFENLTASSNSGGAIYGYASAISIEGSTFTGNSATYGGALNGSSLTKLAITDTTFSANSANQGGAIYSYATTGSITGGLLDGNASSTHGAAMYLSSATTTLTGVTVSNNNAQGSGGAIYAYASPLTIDASDFAYNDASLTSDTSNTWVGGDVRANASAVTVRNGSTFVGSRSDGGGSLFGSLSSSFAISDSSFSGGESYYDGGAILLNGGTLSVTGSAFDGNDASTDGGAISLASVTSFRITDSEFSANHADQRGGAVFVNTASTASSVYRNRFCDNTASTDGGGLWLYLLGTSYTHDVANNLFVENEAADEGGNLYVSTSSTLDVLNNHVITGKAATAKGGGTFAGVVDYKNNLVAYTPAGDGYASAGSSVVTYNAWYSNTATNYSGSGSLGTGNVIGSDPLLLDYAAGDGCSGDFRVRYTSPLRNAGTGTDLDASTADIGMYGGANADPDAWTDTDGDSYPWVYDCDADDPTVFPGATETCDGEDDDCDGTIDEGSTEVCNGVDDDCDGSIDEGVTTTYYADADGDGYGALASATTACTPPSGYVADSSDCDDTRATSSPAGVESCNGLDDDCDGTVDDGVKTTFYRDADGDGYGAAAVTSAACAAPSGYVADATDCDDTDATTSPADLETCDGDDDDCDGTVDEEATDATTYYRDADGDGFGDSGATTSACAAPSGYVADATDCDDTDAALRPGATWYEDADGDGFGDVASTTTACEPPTGYGADDSDCDDTDGTIAPGAVEYCDGIDQDCDGAVDDDVVTYTFYADTDGDGFGDADSTVEDCKAPSGYVAGSEDCDDTDPLVTGPTAWYTDADGDGFGDLSTEAWACDAPEGAVADGSDCDDADDTVGDGFDWYADVDGDALGDASTHERACEAPSGYIADDSDCDDDDPSIGGPPTWYSDADGDDYGDASVDAAACEQPTGYVADATDCDDFERDVHPGAVDQCRNGVDDDCDGAVDEEDVVVDWWPDADGDGLGSGSPVADCAAPSGYVGNDEDCDDADAAVGGPSAWYADVDGDGAGDDGAVVVSCEAPSGYAAAGGDCDDADADTLPGAVELCDGADNDCDGAVDEEVTDFTWYTDADGDGFGDDATVFVDCDRPDGVADRGGDCDDADPDVNPDAEEVVGNGVDEDCDGDDGAPGDSARQWQGSDTDGDARIEGAGCGCDSRSGAPGALGLIVALLAFRRRR